MLRTEGTPMCGSDSEDTLRNASSALLERCISGGAFHEGYFAKFGPLPSMGQRLDIYLTLA